MLEWEEAHVGFDTAVAGLAADRQGVRPAGFDHSAWELLEHLRIAQADILEFCTNATYVHSRKWPDDYWPPRPAPPDARAWDASVGAFRTDRDALKTVGRTVPDLFALVPTGTGHQTYIRCILMAADHAAYHVGQLVAVRRALGAWT